jgi:hypothetical protein
LNEARIKEWTQLSRKKRIYIKYFSAYTKEFGHYKDPGIGMCTITKQNFRRYDMWVGVD